jgi:hypothetical protein
MKEEDFWTAAGIAIVIGFFTAAVWSFVDRLIDIMQSFN